MVMGNEGTCGENRKMATEILCTDFQKTDISIGDISSVLDNVNIKLYCS